MPTPEPRRPWLTPGWRLDHQGEQIYRLWRRGADRPAGVIAAGHDSWTARPFGPEGRRRSWETPTLREAAALMIAHLETTAPAAARPVIPRAEVPAHHNPEETGTDG